MNGCKIIHIILMLYAVYNTEGTVSDLSIMGF